MAPRKKTSTTAAKKTTTTGKKGVKRKPVSTLLKSLPESVEHIQIVQQVAGVLEELQTRVCDVKDEAKKELNKLMKLYEGNYKGLEKKVHQVTTEAKKQAQMSMIHLLQKWHEHKEKLPQPLTKEIEKIIEQIGTAAQKRVVRKNAATKPAKKTTTPRKTSATKRTTSSATRKKTAAVKKVKASTVRKT
ncbi:MAG: hypothetical protein KC505_08685, partial [Myxococcales bacterium]|nr:hypothetical protein [Myxococcales bacterium]